MKKVFTLIISMFLYTSVAFADDRLSLSFNIIADDDSKKNSVIDSKVQKKLSFRLFANQNEIIYYNGSEIVVTDKKFDIDITNLTGKQEIKFTNNLNEEATFTYYIADENGLIPEYTLENKPAYIITVDKTKVIYTDKDKKKINLVIDLIKNMPKNTKVNLTEMKLLPTDHASKAAGITNYDKITFYNLSKYSNSQIKNIVLHEVAHTWAHELRRQKVIDFNFTDFTKAANKDSKYVTNYAKTSPSEDFAESISFYLIDTESFTKNFPERANYISSII